MLIGARIKDNHGDRQVPYSTTLTTGQTLWIPPDVTNIEVSVASDLTGATGSSTLSFDDIRPGRTVKIWCSGSFTATIDHTAFGSAALAGSIGQYTSTLSAGGNVALAPGDTCNIIQTAAGYWVRENTDNA